MLVHRLRRWPRIKPALTQRIVLARFVTIIIYTVLCFFPQQYDRGVRVSKTRSLLPAGGVLGIAVASITVFVIVVAGIVVLRKRAARIPGDNGFVEVDQAASPEERHVANMQINGYENPTYKYFETSPPNA